MILSPKLLNFQLILIGRLCILILSCRIGSLFLLLFMVKLYMLMTTLAWWGRLSSTEEVVRNAMKKLTQGMADHNKAMAAAKTEEAKSKIVSSPLSADFDRF